MHLLPGNAQWIGRRDEQQDAFAFSHIAEDTFRDHGGALAVVADGMGGLANGAEASRLAVKAFLAAYDDKAAGEPVPDALIRALDAANQAVWQLARAGDGVGNVGTTLVAAVIRGPQLFWIGAGDSRLYLYRAAERTLTCCTTDHNLLSDLMPAVSNGTMSREEALDHPDAGALTSFLGMEQISKVDCNLRPLPLEPGDRILLCSDGLYGTIADNALAAALGSEPQAAAETLLDQVKTEDDPHQDNTTIVILGCDQQAAVPTTRRIDKTKQRRPLVPVLAATAIVVALGAALWFSGLLPPQPSQPTQAASPASIPTTISEQPRAPKEADAAKAPPQPQAAQAEQKGSDDSDGAPDTGEPNPPDPPDEPAPREGQELDKPASEPDGEPLDAWLVSPDESPRTTTEPRQEPEDVSPTKALVEQREEHQQIKPPPNEGSADRGSATIPALKDHKPNSECDPRRTSCNREASGLR